MDEAGAVFGVFFNPGGLVFDDQFAAQKFAPIWFFVGNGKIGWHTEPGWLRPGFTAEPS